MPVKLLWAHGLREIPLFMDRFFIIMELCDGNLKVHKIENLFGFDFEFWTISMLVMHK
jgi:hypothetical protein